MTHPRLAEVGAVAARHTWSIVVGVGLLAGFLAGCVDGTGQ